MPSSTVHLWAYDLAKEMIDENGRPMQLVYSKPVDSASQRPGESQTVEAVIDVVGLQTQFKRDERDLWGVSSKDKAIMFDAQVEPHTGWILRDGGKDLRIDNMLSVAPGMTSIIYKVQAVG